MKGKKAAALLIVLIVAVQATGCRNTVEKSSNGSQGSVQISTQLPEPENEKIDTTQVAQERDSSSEEDRRQASQERGIPQEENSVVVECAAEIVGTYEAEEAELAGNVKASESAQGAYVSGFENDGDRCIFAVDIPSDGFYDLNFVSAAEGGYKENYVAVDNDSIGTIAVESADFSDAVVARVYLTQGAHHIAVSKYWGWIKLDKLVVQTAAPIDKNIYQVSADLVNQNATEETRRLMCYLTDIYGKNILSGQYCDQGQFGKEITVIHKATGKFPSVLGLDFIEYANDSRICCKLYCWYSTGQGSRK